MNKNIAVIRGDGIGPEIMNEAILVLDKIAKIYGHTFNYTDVDMSGCAIDKYNEPLPDEELQKCLLSDSVLLGAVGGNKWNDVPKELRPEKGLLKLRAEMGVYSNNRPAKIWPQLADASPLKPSIVEKGIDFIIVRELIGGIYFGEHKTENDTATDVMSYTESEIERIGRIGFETARKRNKKLCSVEKSNVLDTSRLWKKVMHRLAEEYPDVELTDMLVDNCAMQIVKNPAQFDVIVTENMFGDILSDEASMITGSIGMIPSSSLGDSSRGLYEPIHGSAPDIAGKDIANPIGMILSAAMMLKYSFDMNEESDAIEKAVYDVLEAGYRCADIMSSDNSALKKVGCREMGQLIVDQLSKIPRSTKADEPSTEESVNCELMLIKVKNSPKTRKSIRAAADAFKAETIDYTPDSVIMKLTGNSKCIDAFITLMQEFTILEIQRTGTVSIERGIIGKIS